jgi:rod shape-determining protein MreC
LFCGALGQSAGRRIAAEDSNLSRNRSTALVVLLVAAVFIGMALGPTGYLQPVEDGLLTLFAPLQYSVRWVSNRAAALVETVRQFRTLQARVDELEATVDRLMIENVELREAEIERAELREQLQFKLANPTYDLMAAEVIGHDPSNLLHYIIIDRGAEDGLAVGMPVVTARGLVGRIAAVYRQASRVILLTDPGSSVNAQIQRTRATGIVQGQAPRDLVMRFVEQGEQIEVGDIVLTSGLGGNFPKRLVIGQVTSVQRNDVDMFQEIRVQSAVQFDRIEMVLVVKGFSPIDYLP